MLNSYIKPRTLSFTNGHFANPYTVPGPDIHKPWLIFALIVSFSSFSSDIFTDLEDSVTSRTNTNISSPVISFITISLLFKFTCNLSRKQRHYRVLTSHLYSLLEEKTRKKYLASQMFSLGGFTLEEHCKRVWRRNCALRKKVTLVTCLVRQGFSDIIDSSKAASCIYPTQLCKGPRFLFFFCSFLFFFSLIHSLTHKI